MKKCFKDFKFSAGFAVKCVGLAILVVYAVFMIFGNSIFSPMSSFWRSLNIFGTAGEYNAIIRIIINTA